MMRELFGDSGFNKKLWRLMVPIALQSLMLSAVAAGDAVMLGRLAQNSMTGVSLATQVQFIQNMAVFSITTGGTVLGAQYWGIQDVKKINEIFFICLRTAGLISLGFFAACELCPDVLMKIFTNDPELIRIGAGYLRIAGWSYLMTGISQCYQVIMKVTDHVGRVAVISSGAVLLNIGFNAVLIFGLFGFPAMGANGAALATLLARAIELIWCIASSLQKGFLHPDYRMLFQRDPLLAGDYRKITIPLLGAGMFWGVGFTSYTAIIGHLGADAAAANSVSAVVRDLMCCLCNGVSTAGGIMVGNELGAGNLEKGKQYGIRLARISVLIGFLSTAIVLLVTVPTARFMILTDQARSYLIGMMVIMSVYMIGRVVNTVVINGIFDSGGDTAFDVYSLAVAMWGIAIPTALLGAFVFHWPVLLVYSCTCLDEVGKLPWVYIHFKKYKWVKNLTRQEAKE